MVRFGWPLELHRRSHEPKTLHLSSYIPASSTILGFTPRPAFHRGKRRAMSVGETHQVLQGNLAFHTHSTLSSVKMSLDLSSGVNYVKIAI